VAAKYKAVAVVINACELVEASLRLCKLSGGSLLYCRDIVTSINIYHSKKRKGEGQSGANGDGRGASMFLTDSLPCFLAFTAIPIFHYIFNVFSVL